MDKFKDKINSLRREIEETEQKNQVLLSILSQCSCGASSNLQNEIGENTLKFGQLRNAIGELGNKFLRFKEKIDGLLVKVEELRRDFMR